MSRTTISEVYVSRAAVRHAIDTRAKPSTLRARQFAVLHLAEDCARFFPWPALHASLMADVLALNMAIQDAG